MVRYGSGPDPHSAVVDEVPGPHGKYAHQCAVRGCHSGYRFTSLRQAQQAAYNHTARGNAEDERIRALMRGGRS